MTQKIFPHEQLKSLVSESSYPFKRFARDLLNVSEDSLMRWTSGKYPPGSCTEILLCVLLRMDARHPGLAIRELEAEARERGVTLERKTKSQLATEAHARRKAAAAAKPIPRARIAELINQAKARQ